MSTATDRVHFKGLWAEVSQPRQTGRLRPASVHCEAGETRRKANVSDVRRSISLTDLGNYIAGYVAAGGVADVIWPGYRGTVEICK